MTEEETKKEDVVEETEEDWDFDMSLYEEDRDRDDADESIGSLKTFKRANVSGRRSRFSNTIAELEKLAELGSIISKYSIKVESRIQDISLLWKYYGVLSEYQQFCFYSGVIL